MTESQRILQVIGREAMQNLCGEFGGQTVYIPKTVPDPMRDDKIKAMHGLTLGSPGSTCMSTYREVAEEFELTPRRIMEIVNS